jgi:ATP-dependent protease Clp ATPase subunit
MRCSFCRRPDAEVSKLVAGPWRLLAGRVYICDRCAARTIEIMEQPGEGPAHRATVPLFRRILRRLHLSRPENGRSLSAIVTPNA